MMAGRPPLSWHDIRSKLWDLMDKFTMAELAAKLGVSQSAIYYWKTSSRYSVHASTKRLYRVLSDEHKKKLVRLWQYHCRGY